MDEKCLETMNAIFEAVTHYLKEPLLQRIRRYLTAVCLMKYSITQEVEQVSTASNEQKTD